MFRAKVPTIHTYLNFHVQTIIDHSIKKDINIFPKLISLKQTHRMRSYLIF